MFKSILIAAALLLVGTPAAAEVVERSADHFVLRFEVASETTPEDIYTAIGEVGRWWDGSHTYSGDGANLTLPLEVGGCFCEALPDGRTFEHGRVLQADPETGILLEAPLGPLNGHTSMAQLSIGWSAANRGYVIVMTFVVRGPGMGDFTDGVHEVMGGQLSRLARYVEYGEPHGPAAPVG